MRVGWLRRRTGYLLGAGLLLTVVGRSAAWGDDSGFLGRLFRLGGNASSSNNSSTAGGRPAPLPYGPPGSSPPPAGSSAPLPTFGGLTETPGPSFPAGPAQRITPKPRVNSAATSADPVVTRMALGRSNDGGQFAMFLQVFADGTVIDSEGVHRVRPADLKPIMDAVQSGELSRVHGHCGAPSTDFIEYVHVVVYERRFGRLMANPFSYSGNPQGCDHVIRHLHTALEGLQAKLSRHPSTEPAGAVPTSPGTLYNSPTSTPAEPYGLDRQPVSSAPAGTPAGPVIPLTPAEPGR